LKISNWTLLRDENPQVRRVGRNALIYLVGLLIISPLLFGWRFAGGCLIGGGITILAYQWLKKGSDFILSGKKRASIGSNLFKIALRLLLIATVLYGSIKSNFFDVNGIVLGLSTMVAGVIIEGFYQIALILKKGC